MNVTNPKLTARSGGGSLEICAYIFLLYAEFHRFTNMVENAQSTRNQRWVPLGQASRILEVNESTLREWANRGAIRVFRTPGGHRRFSKDDIRAVLESGTLKGYPSWQHQEEIVLRRIRKRLQQDEVSHQSWYNNVAEGGRLRFRLFGRRLLSLLVRAAADRRIPRDILEEAHLLGTEYGAEMAGQGFQLRDTLEAFIFFRRNVMESLPAPSRRRIGILSDRVLIGIAAGCERHGNGQELSAPVYL